MESLQVRTGQICLNILDDAGESRGIFKFNPNDLESAKRVLAFQAEFEEKQAEYEKRIEKCETTEDKVTLLSEICEYFENIIDECFGTGSSEILFGGARTLSMFDDFLNGIMPYYEKASKERIAKYAPKKKK